MWILSLLAGLGLFLYGMKMMGDGLEKVAGDKMSSIIDKLTGNLIKGVLVGAAVTAIIQSSSATTVMVVGFINAGIMTLAQAVGVIMGANIGTTITSVLISLQDIDSSGMWIMNIFKPDFLAPVAVACGVIMLQFLKKRKYNNIGEILAGFGILFIGMDMMSSAMEFLKEYQGFQTMMISLTNPILGVIVGAVLTAVIQSSSASVGILQAAASTGLLYFPGAAAIILGQNIGTCITAIFSAIGAANNAKKAAAVHLLFNVMGSVIFLVVLYAFGIGKLLPVWNDLATKGNIAGFHIAFNLINTIILLPFNKVLVKIADTILPDKGRGADGEGGLEARLLSTPAVAISQTKKELVKMMAAATDAVMSGYDMLNGGAIRTEEEMAEQEDAVDIYEANITQYLIKLGEESVNEEENTTISTMFHVVTDIERIGDHAYNIAQSVADMRNNGAEFSGVAKEQLNSMYEAVNKLLDMTLKAYTENNVKLAVAVQPLEDVIDYLKDHLKTEHLDRLARQECSFSTGVMFLDIVNNLERIADHCSNIGLTVEQLESDESIDFDPHAHLKHIHDNKSNEYTRVYDKYIERYTK